MKSRERIELTDPMPVIAEKMAEGNIGALSVVCAMVKHGGEIDPQNALQGFAPLLTLDSNGIYGPNIWVLHKYICGQKLETILAVLRAVQMGMLDVTVLRQEIQSHGQSRLIDVAEIVANVKERLPQFGSKETVAA